MLFVRLAGPRAHAECMPPMAAVSQSAFKHSAAGAAAAFLSGFIKIPQETPAFRQGRNEVRGRATRTHIRRCVKSVGNASNRRLE